MLMKFEFSQQIFEKYSNIKHHENPSSWSRVIPCGQTDRHDEANIRRHKPRDVIQEVRCWPLTEKDRV